MKTKLYLKCILLFVIFTYNVSDLIAQDTIVKANNETIICKIKEITTDEIKYIDPKISDEIIFAIDKNEIKQVILENGNTLNFSHTLKGKEHYTNQNKNCIKLRLLSPLYGYTDLSYERSIKPGRSFEVSTGIIGLGKQWNEKNRGISVKVGYKFIRNPDFYFKGMKYSHILKGGYFRPELAIKNFTNEDNGYLAYALLMNLGKQWVFDDALVIDYYVGIGYGLTDDDSDLIIGYGFSTGNTDFPIAFSTGFRIGILF